MDIALSILENGIEINELDFFNIIKLFLYTIFKHQD